MEHNYLLTLGEGDQQQEFYIQKAFLMDGKCYFSVLNMATFEVMFGEYLGAFEQDMEAVREQIYQEFVNRCPNVTFVDGYILDDLYEMWDEGVL